MAEIVGAIGGHSVLLPALQNFVLILLTGSDILQTPDFCSFFILKHHEWK